MRAFVMGTLNKEFEEGYLEENASKLTWFEKLDFMVNLLTSLRTSILSKRAWEMLPCINEQNDWIYTQYLCRAIEF